MTTEKSNTTYEAHIRSLIEARVKAVHAKNVNALMSNSAPDILSFDAVNPLHYRGSDAVRTRAEAWFASYQSAIGYEIRDLKVTAGEDTAFCHYLYHVTGTTKTGSKVAMWVRTTVCFSKIKDKWLITHEHTSVPFDIETGKASLDLKP